MLTFLVHPGTCRVVLLVQYILVRVHYYTTRTDASTATCYYSRQRITVYSVHVPTVRCTACTVLLVVLVYYTAVLHEGEA